MAYGIEIKRLGQEAGTRHRDAVALMDQWKGKTMPADVSAQVDTMLDEVQAKTDELKRLERLDAQEKFLGEADPASRLPAQNGGQGDADGKAGERSLESKAFNKALRGGLRALTQTEEKALSVSSDADGGFLVTPQEFRAQLIQAVDDIVAIRRLATVMPLDNAESMGVPTLDADISDAAWTSEIATGNEDSGIKFGKRELKPSPLAKRIKISKKLLRQNSINAEALVRSRLAYKFGVTQEKAFMTGSGNNQPLGVFIASANGIDTSRDTNAAGAAAITGDDVINLKHDLKPQYWPRARWMFHRDIMKMIRKLKTTDGQYLWVPGLTAGVPGTILDIPYELSEFAPNTITTGLYTMILGDFSFYWIVEALALQIQVLTELYAETNQNGYIGRMELDGAPVLAEAFRRLKQA